MEEEEEGEGEGGERSGERERKGVEEEGKERMERERRTLFTDNVSHVYTQIAARVGVRADAVKNMIIWGNHSSTQFPDVAHAYVQQNGIKTPVYDAVQDDAWLKGDFIKVCWNNLIPKPLFLLPY